jgi:hypothetical protein
MDDIFVSVVIVNYNAQKYLHECIDSLVRCNYKNIEIIVVDQGSTDGSWMLLERLKQEEPRLKIIRNDHNLGLSIGRNQGFRISRGKYVAFIDNDTVVDTLWLDRSIPLFERDPKIGACQCKLLIKSNNKDYIDCVGEYLGNFGFLVHIVESGTEIDYGQYDNITEILSPKGAGMILRREALEKIGGFDEDYFIYMDETDACWRIWLAGYKIIFVPESRVYHRSGTTEVVLPDKINYLVKFHGTKNYIMTLIKNLEGKNLIRILLLHLFIWLGVLFYFLLKANFKSCKFIIMGIFWNILYINRILEKRQHIQRSRKVKDRDIFPFIFKTDSLVNRIRTFLFPVGYTGHAVGWNKGD